MEDFQGRIDFLMNKKQDISFKTHKELIIFLKNEAESSLQAELCALIGLDKEKNFYYRQMQNRSKEPYLYFLVDPYDYLSFANNYEMFGIFHSHLIGDENPSEFDMKTANNCCYFFLIYSIMTEKFSIYEPHLKDYDVNIMKGIREII
jgi:proteasome lid subunit RPN8/RPN11